MSCYQCRQDFGFLNKSISCSNCKFAFCKHCVKPFPSDSKIKTCISCIQASEKEEKHENVDIPKNLEKLKEQNKGQKKHSEIKNLENRLADLSKKKKEAGSTTVEDLENRLRKLRGESLTQSDNQAGKSRILLIKPKSDQEQIGELMNQYLDEAVIESKREEKHKNDISEIDNRLNNLRDDKRVRGQDINLSQFPDKTLTEAAFKEKYAPFSDVKDDESDELPYCCLCTEDAKWVCIECDRDLYCDRCYKECHSKKEYGPHQHEPYKRKH